MSPFEENESLKILIIGGGLCGLASALSTTLSNPSHKITVYETASVVHEIGAGLQITPNGNRLLKAWGLWPKLALLAAAPEKLRIRRFDGRLLARRDGYDEEVHGKYGVPVWCLHRVDLQRALVERATELGVDVRLGCRVESVDLERNTITLRGGEVVNGDVIIAADGLWSNMRDIFLGAHTPPKPTGDLAYRVTLAVDQISNPELSAVVKTPGVNIWIGPGAHVVGYNVRGGTLFNMVLLVPDDLPEGVKRQPGDVEEMRKLFEEWDPILTKLLSGVRKVDKWKLMHHPPLDTLSTQSGHFFMVGDSCHPMLPYFAQGANSSFEDAAVLGTLLSKLTPTSTTTTTITLPQIAQIYTTLRRDRVSRIHKETFAHRHEFHLRDGVEQERRDKALGCSFTDDDWTHPKIQAWLWGYDACLAAEEEYVRVVGAGAD